MVSRLSILVSTLMFSGSCATGTLTLSSTGLVGANLVCSWLLCPAAIAIFRAESSECDRSALLSEFVVEKPQAPFARTRIPAPVSSASVTASTCPSFRLRMVLLFLCVLISAYDARCSLSSKEKRTSFTPINSTGLMRNFADRHLSLGGASAGLSSVFHESLHKR